MKQLLQMPDPKEDGTITGRAYPHRVLRRVVAELEGQVPALAYPHPTA
jgi:hypothetical protein